MTNIDENPKVNAELQDALTKAVSGLTEDQIEILTEPILEVEGSASSVGSSKDKEALTSLWLHVRGNRTCWYVKARYEYECFVTQGSKDGPRVTVDRLEMHIIRSPDGADYTHGCDNTSWCPKTDKLYGSFNVCGTTRFKARCRHAGYGTWETSYVLIR